EEMLEECLVPTFEQSSVHFRVWGCIMKGVKGPLLVLEYPRGKGGGMNSERYQKQVLDGKLLKFYADMNAEQPGTLFQQDDAPAHHSKSTQRWFGHHQIPLFSHLVIH
ncbi:hypothetical protein C8J56DRAFT_788619, partial [Mycena floridula]